MISLKWTAENKSKRKRKNLTGKSALYYVENAAAAASGGGGDQKCSHPVFAPSPTSPPSIPPPLGAPKSPVQDATREDTQAQQGQRPAQGPTVSGGLPVWG